MDQYNFVLAEPESAYDYSMGIIATMTGNDKMYARSLENDADT